MLNNKADAVEHYILKMLSENENGQVVLKRTDLADEISCAPSQISYVLSTRFTNSRGFKVESQRGLGGYIRITIIDNNANSRKDFYRDIHTVMLSEEDIPFELVTTFLKKLVEEDFITTREAKLVAQSAYNLYDCERMGMIDARSKKLLVDALFATLEDLD